MKLLAALSVVIALPAALHAQAGQQQPQTPYKPEFVIPKPEGPGQSTASRVAPPNSAVYKIGPQDQLKISVFDEPDMSTTYRVDADGFVTFPLIGRVSASGATLIELEQRITGMLANGYIKNPQVRIEIDQYKSQSVFVIGEVRTPGKITMSGSMNLLEALALAGSPTANASNQVIVVHPRKPNASGSAPPTGPDAEGPSVTINRKDLELGRGAGQDVVLQDGDIINVPPAQRFYMSGYVRNPGFYLLDPGMTVAQAIALAGGLNDRGSDRRITATRIVNGKSAEVKMELEDKVQPNDTINIPARFF